MSIIYFKSFITTTFISLLCQKGQLTLHLCPRRWFGRKIFGYYPQNVIIEKSSYKLLRVHKGGIQETACPKVPGRLLWFSSELFKAICHIFICKIGTVYSIYHMPAIVLAKLPEAGLRGIFWTPNPLKSTLQDTQHFSYNSHVTV